MHNHCGFAPLHKLGFSVPLSDCIVNHALGKAA